uniref:Uncharacterized protein n=1 Tax=uncultured euryarchaeote Rifle_16ft_4_minimus_309 TaxID=1665192 RepID=A0A0H4T2T9_9EURY|nr:hypothetical protein [uncultured euryarchaeote Rifle_16ft_4_minimus_309]
MGPGSAPALCGPTRSAPPESTHARLPPPAPTDSMSTTGIAIGNVSIIAFLVHEGRPRTMAERSALVPPMSKVTRSLRPVRRERATAAATPPAGPLRTMSTGRRTAWRCRTVPPDDFITWKSRPNPSARSSRYRATSGLMYASRTVVDERSYSRNSARTSWLTETGSPRRAFASRRSWSRRRNEKSSAIATDSAPLLRIARATRSTSRADGAFRTRPEASTRSARPKQRSRSTGGGGRAILKSYKEGRFCRPMVRRSSNPFVVTKAVRAPLRSRIAFVATVVPWAIAVAPSSRRPFRTAEDATGVEGIFVETTRPAWNATKSVNVPPTSTPTSTRAEWRIASSPLSARFPAFPRRRKPPHGRCHEFPLSFREPSMNCRYPSRSSSPCPL